MGEAVAARGAPGGARERAAATRGAIGAGVPEARTRPPRPIASLAPDEPRTRPRRAARTRLRAEG